MKNLLLFSVPIFMLLTSIYGQKKSKKTTYYDDWPVEVESNEISTKEKKEGISTNFVTIGTTWDHRVISYFFSNGTPDIPGAGEEQAIRDGFALWEAVTDLVFIESCVEADADIVILYGAFSHGDT
ncbi:MAG: matrixin family metalloprotease, partial [Fulvivirga sp.]|uniref:matrixin family metalloprotease n=1 Tax=Fulvivirga sp. TaxID=1931237 RepID=UPI0032EB3CD2